jgi:ferredoxin-type protein NapF
MSDRPDLSRRGFLSGALLTSAGRRELEHRMHPLGPLSPAARVSGDLDACRACVGPCVQACSVGIVHRHADDHANPGLAYLDFSSGGCTLCGDCVRVCPACDSAVTMPERLGLARIDTQRCVAYQDVICVSCRLGCRTRAVDVDNARRPWIDAEGCTGCGGCVSVCPVDAIEVAVVPEAP